MHPLPPPTADAGAVFRDCVSTVQDAGFRGALLAVATDVELAAAEFAREAARARLDTITPDALVGGTITAADMTWVYDNCMVRKQSRGRPLYDALRAAPPHGTCPLCGQRDVSTLDHHLPKALYPALAVAPANLVPACKDCNTVKRTEKPTGPGDQTLHPYFDRVDGARWLHAAVLEGTPAAVVYRVQPPASWSPHLARRARHYFRVFQLGTLYSSHAANELVSRRHRLSQLRRPPGAGARRADDVRAHLADERDAHEAAQLNSWQSAMYRALAASDWYCDRGFAA